MQGTKDPFTRSERTLWENCKWWRRSDFGGSVPNDKYVYELTPYGTFRARESSDFGGSSFYSSGYNAIGSVMVKSDTITIMTTDDISEMKQYDLVLFMGKIWKVAYPIRKSKSRRKDMFSRSDDFTYSVELAK